MTDVVRSSPDSTEGADAPDPRRWWALAVLAASQLIIVLDASIVNIALPSAQAELGISDADRQWVVTAYTLAFGSLLLLGGRLADYVGRKRIFLVGLGGFAVASAPTGTLPPWNDRTSNMRVTSEVSLTRTFSAWVSTSTAVVTPCNWLAT